MSRKEEKRQRRIEEAFERSINKKEQKLNRELSPEEERKILEGVTRKVDKNMEKEGKTLRTRIKITLAAMIAALGIGTGVKLLNDSNTPKNPTEIETNINNDENEVEETTEDKTTTNDFASQYQYGEYVQEALDEYNRENGTNITTSDLGYIKSNPQFMTKDGEDNWVYDYKEKTEAKEYVTDSSRIGNIYIAVDKQNKQIVTALGRMDGEIVNVEAKQAKTSSTEYTAAENMVDLTLDENGQVKDSEIIEKEYKTLENEYQKALDKISQNDQKTQSYEIAKADNSEQSK